MTGTIETRDQAPIDMSFRLWSDEIELYPVVCELGFEPTIVHSPGAPMSTRGPLARRIAERHYASTARNRGHNSADVTIWLTSLLGRLEADEMLVDLIRSGRIEAVLWIALLGRQPISTPEISQAIVSRFSSIGVVFFIEDYTHLEHGNPVKVWLPAEPPARGSRQGFFDGAIGPAAATRAL